MIITITPLVIITKICWRSGYIVKRAQNENQMMAILRKNGICVPFDFVCYIIISVPSHQTQ